MLTFLYLTLASMFVVYCLVARRQKVFSPLVMYFLGTLIFIYPGALLEEGVHWPVRHSTAWAAFFALLLSLCFLWAGSLATNRRQRELRPTSTTDVDLKIPTAFLIIMLIVMMIIRAFLDPDTIIGKILTQVTKPETVAGQYFVVLVSLPVSIACLAPWLWERARSRNIYSALAIFGIVLTGMFGLSRTPIFYVLGCWLFHLAWNNRRLWRSYARRIAVAILLVAAVPIVTVFAAFIKGTNLLVEAADAGYHIDFYDAIQYAAAQHYTLAVSDVYGVLLFILDSYPEKYGYMPGHALAVLITSVIPRAIFEWKPWTASYHITNQILGEGTFETSGHILAASFIGELWMNGGWAAIAIGSFVLGAIGGLLQGWFARNAASLLHRMVYFIGLIMFILIPRGDLLAAFFRGVVYIGFAYLFAKVVVYLFQNRRRRVQRRSQSGTDLGSVNAAPARD